VAVAATHRLELVPPAEPQQGETVQRQAQQQSG